MFGRYDIVVFGRYDIIVLGRYDVVVLGQYDLSGTFQREDSRQGGLPIPTLFCPDIMLYRTAWARNGLKSLKQCRFTYKCDDY